MTCPWCGRQHPPSTPYCECGYEFVPGSRPMDAPPVVVTRVRSTGEIVSITCLGMIISGVLLAGAFYILLWTICGRITGH